MDVYQINCTYYDALGRDDAAYLLVRAVQFFTPGIPPDYYVGLLAGGNDMDLLGRSGVGRDINRHYFGRDEIEHKLTRPVVAALVALIRFRNAHQAFSGHFAVEGDGSRILMTWTLQDQIASLEADFSSRRVMLIWTGPDGKAHSCEGVLDLSREAPTTPR